MSRAAYALGKPVVGSATGGLLEQVDPGMAGELFTPGAASGMARAFVRGLGDRDHLRWIKEETRRRWEPSRAWDGFESAVRDVYEQVLGSAIAGPAGTPVVRPTGVGILPSRPSGDKPQAQPPRADQ